jgi:hypothetical protein
MAKLLSYLEYRRLKEAHGDEDFEEPVDAESDGQAEPFTYGEPAKPYTPPPPMTVTPSAPPANAVSPTPPQDPRAQYQGRAKPYVAAAAGQALYNQYQQRNDQATDSSEMFKYIASVYGVDYAKEWWQSQYGNMYAYPYAKKAYANRQAQQPPVTGGQA